MMLKLAKNKKYRKYVFLFICLSLVGNLTHWKVLCFGADGHIEIESAFHERCNDPEHAFSSDKNVISAKEGHEVCDHCEPCVDIPIFKDLVQNSNSPQKLNQNILVSATNILNNIDNLSNSANKITSDILNTNSYFTPLRTVILLI